MIGWVGVSLDAVETPLGRLMLNSFSTTCIPAEAMKKSINTNTTSTIGAI